MLRLFRDVVSCLLRLQNADVLSKYLIIYLQTNPTIIFQHLPECQKKVPTSVPAQNGHQADADGEKPAQRDDGLRPLACHQAAVPERYHGKTGFIPSRSEETLVPVFDSAFKLQEYRLI